MKFACFTAALLTMVLEQQKVAAVSLDSLNPEGVFEEDGSWLEQQFAEIDN